MTTVLIPAQRATPVARTTGRARPPADWVCVNCDEPNVGRRKRCRDCGTTRD